MISRSRGERRVFTASYSCRTFMRKSMSSKMWSSVAMVSSSVSVLPSLSVSMGSFSDTSCAVFFALRKNIRISFSMHREA